MPSRFHPRAAHGGHIRRDPEVLLGSAVGDAEACHDLQENTPTSTKGLPLTLHSPRRRPKEPRTWWSAHADPPGTPCVLFPPRLVYRLSVAESE